MRTSTNKINNSLVPYGFDRGTVDQSTKFCSVTLLVMQNNFRREEPLPNHPAPLGMELNFFKPQKLNQLYLCNQFPMHTNSGNVSSCHAAGHSSHLNNLLTSL